MTARPGQQYLRWSRKYCLGPETFCIAEPNRMSRGETSRDHSLHRILRKCDVDDRLSRRLPYTRPRPQQRRLSQRLAMPRDISAHSCTTASLYTAILPDHQPSKPLAGPPSPASLFAGTEERTPRCSDIAIPLIECYIFFSEPTHIRTSVFYARYGHPAIKAMLGDSQAHDNHFSSVLCTIPEK